MFFKCRHLSKVTIPKGLEELNNSCFAYSGISEILVPKSVKIIAFEAFSQCKDLKKVVFEEGSLLEIVKDGAFSGT